MLLVTGFSFSIGRAAAACGRSAFGCSSACANRAYRHVTVYGLARRLDALAGGARLLEGAGMADPRGIRTRAEWNRALQALFDRAGLSYHVLAERSGIVGVDAAEDGDGAELPQGVHGAAVRAGVR